MGLWLAHLESAVPTMLSIAYQHRQYTGETNPGIWLKDFWLTYRARGVDHDHFIIQYLPICMGEHVRAWLKFLPHDSIHDWTGLKRTFIGNFQGTYVYPGNSWDLKS